MKKLSAASLAAILCLGGISAAQAADVINVNLSVANRITFTALSGASAITASGPTLTGFYFQNLLAGTSILTGQTLFGAANLTAASVVSDGSPALFRFSATDPGLNIWSYSAIGTTTFTAGATAFTGSATWNVSPAIYAAALAGSRGGNVYFPADDVGDLGTAGIIGTYTVTVPEPSTYALMGAGAAALLLLLRRQQSRV